MAELAVGEMMIGRWVCGVRQCNEAGERFLFCLRVLGPQPIHHHEYMV